MTTKTKTKTDKKKMKKLLLGVACVVVALFAAATLFPRTLPVVSQTENMLIGGEAYDVYDISELVSANPWRENTKLRTLPVYENEAFVKNNIGKGDFDEMKKVLKETARKLGFDMGKLEIRDDAPNEERIKKIKEKYAAVGEKPPQSELGATMVMAEQNGVKIEVDGALTATIQFDPPRELPDGYKFDHHTPYDEMRETAKYLRKEYRKLIGARSAQTNIFGGTYNYALEQSYDLSFFDAVGDARKQIINYNLGGVQLYGSGDKLWLARVYNYDRAEKLGDYPVISVKEAKEKLYAGEYKVHPACGTGKDAEITEETEIAKTELVYRAGSYAKYYIPYYRFYIEVDGDGGYADENIKCYNAFYVPAIEDEYIEKRP